MTDKDLKNLSRVELLEMLIAQSKEVERLEDELEQTRQQLEHRQILLNDAGSIADACLKINGVFEAAQAAADEYLVSVRLRHEKQDIIAKQMEEEAKARVEDMVAQTEEKCRLLEQDTTRKCAEMVRKAREDSDAHWKEVSAKVDAYLKQHSELRNLLYLELISDTE